MKKRRVSWEMPDTLLEDLERAKWRLRMSKSEIIREALKEYIATHVKEEEEELTREELKGLMEGIKDAMRGKVIPLKEVMRGLKGCSVGACSNVKRGSPP